MLLKLFAPETSFFDTFERLGELGKGACQDFLSLTTAGTDTGACAARIHELGQAAAQVTRRSREALHGTFVTPLDRTAIQDLISGLGGLVDAVDAASSRISLYELRTMRPEVKALAEVLTRASVQLAQALRDLRDLRNAPQIREGCATIKQLEEEGDTLLVLAMGRLLKESDPLLILKWQEIFALLEKAAGHAGAVADLIEEIVSDLLR